MIRNSCRGKRFIFNGEYYGTKLRMIQSIMKKYPRIKPENIRIRLIATIATNGGVTVHRKEYERIVTPKYSDMPYTNCKMKKVYVGGRINFQCEEKLFTFVSESLNQAQMSKPKTSGGNKMPTINTSEVLLPIVNEKSKKARIKHRHLKFIGEEERKYNIDDPPSYVKKSSSLRRAHVKD